MKTAALVAQDLNLIAALQTAAARHELLLVTAQTGAGISGPLLVQQGQGLQCHEDGVTSPVQNFSLPLRLGAVIDWLLRQQRRVPAIDLGASGQLEPQARRLVQPDGTALALTEKEVEIIACLANAAAPMPRDQLMATVWGYSPAADTHTLETHIYRLRQKLEAAGVGALLLTGEKGYYLERA